MKQFLISATLLIFVSVFSQYVFAVNGENFEYHGFFRSGIGNNSKGGDQVCLTNPGAGANEFRVGNECSTYGELSFVAHHLKSKSPLAPFFKTQFRLAFNVQSDQDWETNTTNSTGQDITLDTDGDGDVDTDDSPTVGDTDGGDLPAFRELYFEGGNLDGSPLSFWVGKRFYREQDIFMHDYFYFADLSGPGAGIGNIPFWFNANLNLAYLKRVDATTATTRGNIALNVFDLRLKNVQVSKNHSLQFWGAMADTPSARNSSDGTLYSDNKGHAGGVLWQSLILGGFNHLSVIYGKGLLDGLNVWGTLLTEVNSNSDKDQQKSNRWRISNHTTIEPNASLAMHSILLYERRDSGSNNNNIEEWYSVGVQPVYRITNHYQIVSVFGFSVVDAEGSGAKKLTRFTIAPQISVGRSIWARPVIRMFYTRSWWNANNRGVINNNVFANETSGGSWGFQGEVWF